MLGNSLRHCLMKQDLKCSFFKFGVLLQFDAAAETSKINHA